MKDKKYKRGKHEILRVVRTPMFRKRVEKIKTKYNRKEKHKSEDSYQKAYTFFDNCLN